MPCMLPCRCLPGCHSCVRRAHFDEPTPTAAHTACLPSACPLPPCQAFLNKFLKKESDAGEVQFAVELLQDLDAAGDTEGVRALVESYLPK